MTAPSKAALDYRREELVDGSTSLLAQHFERFAAAAVAAERAAIVEMVLDIMPTPGECVTGPSTAYAFAIQRTADKIRSRAQETKGTT